MLAITVPFLEKFACVVAGKIIGLSRHPDYFEYHYFQECNLQLKEVVTISPGYLWSMVV